MSPSAEKCDIKLLQQLLQDSLNQRQEEELARHLEQCPVCRDHLENSAAGAADWKLVGSILRQETSEHRAVQQPGLQTTLLPQSISSIVSSSPRPASFPAEDFAVDFLQPSDNPDVLGTLNQIEIESVIGQGGNGIVLKGRQPELNRLVAVKVMAPQLATSAAARTRFAREAQATAAIVHPSVMPILTVHSQGQLPYLVMPFVDCESLQQRIDREGALPVVDVLRIGHQIAEGLAAAHAQGLVHRDVKPANILLEKGVDRVMLTDFGLARAVDDGSLTRTGVIAGTPQYMSPEQARGDLVDTRSDLFSLGSVLYAMCTGRPPFRAETTYGILRRVTDEQPQAVQSSNTAVPVWLSGFIGNLLEKQPLHREASADSVAETLRGALAHLQQPLTRPLPASLKPFKRSHRRILPVAFVGLILVAAAMMTIEPWRAFEEASEGGPAPPSPAQSDSETDSASADPDDGRALEMSPVEEWSTTLDEDLSDLTRSAEGLLNTLESSAF